MAYEIVRFQDERGGEVAITPRDIKETFCPSATDNEVQLFLALCATQKLNPFAKDAYLVKYGNAPAQMITSRAAIQKRADANPEFEGVEIGVVVLNSQGAIERRPGDAAYYTQIGEVLLGGWARAYRTGRKPYYSEVPLSEYSTGKSGWAKMPGTMITKVAEMHALRGQFPQEFSGMYADEEMQQAREQPVQATVQSVEPAPKPKPTLPEEDRAALAEMADELEGWGVQNAKRQLWVAYNEGGIEGARDAYGSLLPKRDDQPDELADADYYDVDQAF